MGTAADKLRVLIPTTNGTVEVLLLTEEDAAIGRCVACIGGTTETADIAAAYHAFVVRPTGIIESLFGHSCYRLDVSGRIDAGSSWQLGVLAAHALHAAGRLAEEKDTPTGVVWATGSVRPVDLTVGGVSHIPEKLTNSLDRLKQEAAAGRSVLMAIPEPNAAELSPALAADLATHGIKVITPAHAQALFDALAMKLPDGAQRANPAAPRRVQSPTRPRKRLVFAAAATAALLCVVIASAAFLLIGRPPVTVAAPEPTPKPAPMTELAQGEPKLLVPELVPFVSDRDQIRIRDLYMSAPDYKALALSSSHMSFVTGQPDQGTADTAAMAGCQKDTDYQRARAGRVRASACELYASGNTVVATRGRPPLPPQPWLIRDPSVETPFAVADIPLLGERERRQLEKTFAKDRKTKALAISATGVYSSYAGEPSIQQATRRALERCGYNAGVPCMVVAIDDVFVVPIPRSMKVVGFFRFGTINAIAPELRDDLARRLGNATTGWNAVAVGASGRIGVVLGAGAEQAAIDGSMNACSKQDRDCRVVLIGPFLVERDASRNPTASAGPAATP